MLKGFIEYLHGAECIPRGPQNKKLRLVFIALHFFYVAFFIYRSEDVFFGFAVASMAPVLFPMIYLTEISELTAEFVVVALGSLIFIGHFVLACRENVQFYGQGIMHGFFETLKKLAPTMTTVSLMGLLLLPIAIFLYVARNLTKKTKQKP